MFLAASDVDRHRSVETTRLLAAGTYLDDDYREAVLDSTVRSPARFVCPSFGVDVAMVVRHALVAHRRAVVRDLVLLLDLVGLVIVLLHLLRSGTPSLTGGALLAEQGGAETGGGGSGRSLLALAVLGVVAPAVVLADSLLRLDTLWRYFARGRDPADGPFPGGLDATDQIRALEELAEGNLVVFSSRRPFVGSGVRQDHGTAAMPLQGVLTDPERAKTGEDRERRRRAPVPFDERELLDRLSFALQTLDLPGLRVQERVYVNGVDASLVFGGRLLRDGADRPTAFATPEDVRAALADPLGAARHYLCAETTSWHGHLVSTTFIRVVKLPEMLYVETSAYALPPLNDFFFTVDRPDVLDVSTRVPTALSEAVGRVVPLLVRSPVAVLRAVRDVGRPGRQLARHRATVRNGVIVDQGARTSLREAAATDARVGLFFIDQDMVMHTRTVAARVTEVLREFLAEHGYDIGELNFRQDVSLTSISNSGSIGAIGTGAQGTVHQGSDDQPSPAAT